MANTFYQPGADRAAKVQDLFSAIASRYDLINDLQSFGWHRRWKRRLVPLAALPSASRVLDLCCGTGDVTFAFARAGHDAVGLDFSPAMLAVARHRPDAARWPVSWLNADALRLPFPDSAFDAVTISYGLRNLSDFEGGLREMHRVARPGGRLLVLDFGKPRPRFLRACYFAYLRYWVPVFGRLFCGNAAAYAYILESLRHYPAQGGIVTLLQNLGCDNVQVHELLGGVMSIHVAEKP